MNKMDNMKDKFVGDMKETVGKISGSSQMELKGKLQHSKADMKNKMNGKLGLHEMKENAADKINNMVDKVNNIMDKKNK